MKDTVSVGNGEKIKLQKIVVEMGDTKVNLTVEQARELCALLKGLFGDDSTKIIHEHDYWYHRPWYVGPTWTYCGSNWNTSANVSTGVYTLSTTASI